MAYDEGFAERIRAVLGDGEHEVVAKKMFGGIGFMVNGNLCCGIYKNHLMLHVADDESDGLAKRTGAKLFEMRERVMKGWILVEPAAVKTDAALKKWMRPALKHVESLPPKAAKTPIAKRVLRSKSKTSV